MTVGEDCNHSLLVFFRSDTVTGNPCPCSRPELTRSGTGDAPKELASSLYNAPGLQRFTGMQDPLLNAWAGFETPNTGNSSRKVELVDRRFSFDCSYHCLHHISKGDCEKTGGR